MTGVNLPEHPNINKAARQKGKAIQLHPGTLLPFFIEPDQSDADSGSIRLIERFIT